MNTNFGHGRAAHRGSPWMATAFVAAVMIAGCQGERSLGPSQARSTTYQGTFAGATGENGVITIVFPAATPAPALGQSAARPGAPVGSTSALLDVTGTLTPAGGGTVHLTGTFDPSTGALSMTGGGYTFSGTLAHANVSGTYAGPNGSGTWAALPTSAGPPGAVVSGTYTGSVSGANTDGSGAFSGPIAFQFVQTGTAITGTWTASNAQACNGPSTGTLNGTVNGSNLTLTMTETAPCPLTIAASGTITNGGASISGSLSGGPVTCSPKPFSGTFQAGRGVPGTWTSKVSMPTATGSPAPTAGVINGVLYVVGGTSATGTGTALTTLQAYDPTSNTWTAKASMSVGREGAAAGVINGVLYVAGGVGSGGLGRAPAIAAVEAYDPATNTWTTKAPMPTARGGAAAGVIKGILYVAGGASSTTSSSADLAVVEAYDPATDTWTTKASVPTTGFGMASDVINGILYLAGGDASPAALQAYNPATDSWTPKAFVPTARAGAAAGVINGILYVVGGLGCPVSPTTLATLEAYNPATNTWAMKALMPTARGTLAAGVINGVLYVAGGATTTSNSSSVAALEAFTP